MPKFLFSKFRLYEIKDIFPNVQKPRRTDIVLNHKRRGNDIWRLVRQKVNEKCSSDLSCQDVQKNHTSLQKLLKDKKYLAAFRTFLESEFSEENVDFWLACEDFRSAASAEDLRWRAEQIYEEFIRPTACREINVDHHIREKIQRSLLKPSPSCFDEAQKHVYLLMSRDSCPRFLHSHAYLSLKNKSKTLWYV